MNTLKLSIITCFSILYSLTSFAEVKSDVSIEIAIRDIVAKLLRLTFMKLCCILSFNIGTVKKKSQCKR